MWTYKQSDGCNYSKRVRQHVAAFYLFPGRFSKVLPRCEKRTFTQGIKCLRFDDIRASVFSASTAAARQCRRAPCPDLKPPPPSGCVVSEQICQRVCVRERGRGREFREDNKVSSFKGIHCVTLYILLINGPKYQLYQAHQVQLIPKYKGLVTNRLQHPKSPGRLQLGSSAEKIAHT